MNIGTIVELFETMMKSNIDPNAEGAYGGGMANSAGFNPVGFIKKPQVILRIVSLLFSVVVFGCLASEDNYKKGQCSMNESGACGFGVFVGVFAFLACVAFLIIDARFDSFSNVKTRKRAVIADMAVSGFGTFDWFLAFCYMADQWRKADSELSDKAETNKIQTAIAFSFFSIITWAMMCLLNFLRYRQGVSTIFSSGYEDQSLDGNQEYTGGNNTGDQYNNIGGSNVAGGGAPFNNDGAGYQQQPNY